MRLTDSGWGDADRDPAALVRAAIDSGVPMLDTAEMYGNEELVGRAIGTNREHITLCSKFGVYRGPSGRPDDWNVRADSATVRAAIDGSLRRLDVDHLDLYYLHHRSEDTPIEETVNAMAELRQAGKIRALGLSNVTLDDIRRAHAVHPITAVQEQWSLIRRDVELFLQRSPTSGSHWSHIRRWGTATSTIPPAILSLGPLPASLLVSERRLARSLLRGSISAGAGSRPPSFPCPAPRASLIYKPTLLLRELISVRLTWRTLMMSRSKQGSSKAVC